MIDMLLTSYKAVLTRIMAQGRKNDRKQCSEKDQETKEVQNRHSFVAKKHKIVKRNSVVCVHWICILCTRLVRGVADTLAGFRSIRPVEIVRFLDE
jgi:hypothetical protein